MRGARKRKFDGAELRKAGPAGETEVPQPPAWMRAAARKEFQRIVWELQELGLLAEACVQLIESTAIMAERLQTAHRKGEPLHSLSKEYRLCLETLGLASSAVVGAARHERRGRPPGGGDTRDDLIC